MVERGETGLFCLSLAFAFAFARRVRGTGLRWGTYTFSFAFPFAFAFALSFSFAFAFGRGAYGPGGVRLRDSAGRRGRTLRAGAGIGLAVPGVSEALAGGGVPEDAVGGRW